MTAPRHPAKYTPGLLPTMAGMLVDARRVLDPFAGTGRTMLLREYVPDAQVVCVELERDWAAQFEDEGLGLGWMFVGNALCLPFADAAFDAVCTSPTYGNRMADHHIAQDGSRRISYKHCLGRDLHPDNSGMLQWGEGYRLFHWAAWAEACRVLQPGGRLVLNVKDHIRDGRLQRVTEWHQDCLVGLGLSLRGLVTVPCPGMRDGRNREARVAYESVLLFVKECT